MASQAPEIEDLVHREYEHGFVTDVAPGHHLLLITYANSTRLLRPKIPPSAHLVPKLRRYPFHKCLPADDSHSATCRRSEPQSVESGHTVGH